MYIQQNFRSNFKSAKSFFPCTWKFVSIEICRYRFNSDSS